MAQVQTVAGDKRYGFDYKASTTYDGRITAISATKYNNILMCDYENNKLILCDELGNILRTLSLVSSPWDVAISAKNIAFVTLPEVQTVLVIDPDRLCICSRFNKTFLETKCSGREIMCVAALTRDETVFLGCNTVNHFLSVCIYNDGGSMNELTPTAGGKEMAMKYHTTQKEDKQEIYFTHFRCVAGKDYVSSTRINRRTPLSFFMGPRHSNIQSPSLRIPSDVCSDDNGHVYVSGQNSNNIVRFTDDGNILDIPLSDKHGITTPVAICFNSDYSKFYVVDEFGKRVNIYDTV